MVFPYTPLSFGRRFGRSAGSRRDLYRNHVDRLREGEEDVDPADLWDSSEE